MTSNQALSLYGIGLVSCLTLPLRGSLFSKPGARHMSFTYAWGGNAFPSGTIVGTLSMPPARRAVSLVNSHRTVTSPLVRRRVEFML